MLGHSHWQGYLEFGNKSGELLVPVVESGGWGYDQEGTPDAVSLWKTEQTLNKPGSNTHKNPWAKTPCVWAHAGTSPQAASRLARQQQRGGGSCQQRPRAPSHIPPPGGPAGRCSALSSPDPSRLPGCHWYPNRGQRANRWCARSPSHPKLFKGFLSLSEATVTPAFPHGATFTAVSHLLIEVGQPVHAFQLVALQLPIEDGGLWDVLTSSDRRVGQAVALPEAGVWGGGHTLGGEAADLGLLVEQPRLGEAGAREDV